jgi:UDP-N-acetylmuramoyl-tripeptide--D-alanyl-D-alanine ligase
MPEGRYQPIDLLGGVHVIYDAYNANASGTIASLEAFALEPGNRRIAVLASMAELGEESAAMHVRVGAHAVGASVDWLLVGGEYADKLSEGARSAGLSSERIVAFATNSEAAQWLRDHALAGDVVLLKGSRKYKLEEIVEELQR